MGNKFGRFEIIALSRLRDIIRNDDTGKELEIIEDDNEMTEKEIENFLSWLFHFELFKGEKMHNQLKTKVAIEALNEVAEEYPEYVAEIIQATRKNIKNEDLDEIFNWLQQVASK